MSLCVELSTPCRDGSDRRILVAFAARPEIKTEDDPGFDRGRIVGRANQGDEIKVCVAGRAPLNAGTDAEFRRRGKVVFGGIFKIHFDAHAQLVVQDSVTDALAKAAFGFERAGNLSLVEEVESPMPAGAKVLAEQQLQFICIGVMGVEFPFAIERWVEWNFVPVGQSIAQFERLTVLFHARILIVGVIFIEIDLEAIGKARFYFSLEEMVVRLPRAEFAVPPLLDFKLPGREHVDARGGEAPLAGPSRLLIVSYQLIFHQSILVDIGGDYDGIHVDAIRRRGGDRLAGRLGR